MGREAHFCGKAVKVPMQLFAGMSDETAGYTSTEAEYAQLQKLGFVFKFDLQTYS